MKNNLTKIALMATFAVAMAFTFSCTGGDDGGGGGGDSCSISGYKTKKIGTQTWMIENLNCNVAVSECYDKKESNCDKYGRLYDWETAKKACQSLSGWHLPSNDEWDALVSYIESDKGCTRCAGKHLKATSGWDEGSNGTDSYGFAGLPGGYRYSTTSSYGSFEQGGKFGNWWGDGNVSNNDADAWRMNGGDEFLYIKTSKGHLNSVRCIKD